MDMPRTEDSIDVAAAFAVLDTLAARRGRLARALHGRGRDDCVLEHAPATVALRAGMSDRLTVNAL
jgi:hypothetical protein